MSNYQIIILSDASKGHNPLSMISKYCRVTLHCIDIIDVMLLSDDLTYKFVLSNVVSKHLLLALNVLCLLWELSAYTWVNPSPNF